jgi:outer membrane protein assembly factor BamB
MLLALAEEDGHIEWKIEFPTVNGIDQSGDTLVATTADGLVALDAENGDRIWESNDGEEFATVSNLVVVDDVVAYISSNNVIDQELYTGARNILHIVDLSDGTELQRFELGVGDSYGLSTLGDAVVCSVGEELICIENFPTPPE